MIYIIGGSDSIFIRDYMNEIGLDVGAILLDTCIQRTEISTQVSISSPAWWWYKIISLGRRKFIKYVYCILLGLSFSKNDVVHIHFLGGISITLILFAARLKRAKRIITFWGSDLFVNENIKKFKARQLSVRFASYITLSTDQMFDFFASKYKIDIQTRHARFALPNIEILKKHPKNLVDHTNRINIKIGYNARKQQQHLEILSQLQQLPNPLKEQLMLTIPLSYGRVDENYLSSIRMIVDNSLNIKTALIENFLNDFDIAESIYRTDIFLNLQRTDAQSASMQEHMYGGSIVITGDWLPYDSLRKSGCYFYSIPSITNLNQTLTTITNNIYAEKKKAQKNKEIIYGLSSWKAVKNQWLSLYNF